LTVTVETIGLSKRYGYLYALKNVTLKIKKGESVALMGPNGAGKTTLMKVIATHIVPSSGTMKIFGENPFKNGEKVRKRIGFVGHESFLYDELTIKENLFFYAKVFSVNNEDFLDIIDFLNLKRWYNVQVKQLSHGLRKRADIVRALIHNPELILLDELFAGLDAETCNILVDYFKSQQEKTIIISSHSTEWAKKLCMRGVFLNRGEIVKDKPF